MSRHANVVLHWFNGNTLPSFPIVWYNGDPLQFTFLPRISTTSRMRIMRLDHVAIEGLYWFLGCRYKQKYGLNSVKIEEYLKRWS